eukprot:365742-Chlamydomonas_euryale.AAC.12
MGLDMLPLLVIYAYSAKNGKRPSSCMLASALLLRYMYSLQEMCGVVYLEDAGGVTADLNPDIG